MSCSNRKYENPESKKFQDLQEILNEFYEVNQNLAKNLQEAETQIVEIKDAAEDLHRRLCEREDEINSISLRVFQTEQENMELRAMLDNNHNHIERVSIELDNHSH